jgi:hypothetical protein
MIRRLTILAALGVATALAIPTGASAVAPGVPANWVTQVSTTSANLRAEIDTHNLATTYRFDYVTEAEYIESGFDNATRIPSGVEASLPKSKEVTAVVQHPGSLTPGTAYRYRVVASNVDGTTEGPIRPLTTDEVAPVFSLPDGRGWEMVSPVDKNGGEVQSFGGNFGGGVIQAAAQGGAITYTSSSSFGNAQGSPGSNQYISDRDASAWSTDNVTLPMLSGTYGTSPTSGVPYQIFSSDLLDALVSNGRRCRVSTTSQCPVENAPMPGSGAPAGYRNFYMRDNANDSYDAVLSEADIADLQLGAEDFEVAIAGVTPSLAHVVLSTCAALTAGATEVPGSGGECDSDAQNLYEQSGAGGLSLVNSTPGAALAAQGRSISADGSRVYWTDGTNLYVNDGGTNKQVDDGQGGGGVFQTAAIDGSVALFTKGAHLYRYMAAGDTATDLTPGGGVEGVLGASDDASHVYFIDGDGVSLWNAGTTTPVALGASPDSYPPTTGEARVSGDGEHLLFGSATNLTIYDSRGLQEVYLYDAAGDTLTCVSCPPSGELPIGPGFVPGASFNGIGVNQAHSYKPRVLSSGGDRLYFNSFDSLAPQDSNKDVDVYQWEAGGVGSCAKDIGCINLISNGRSENGASFLDASASGSDVFFLTDASLVPTDPAAGDVYDARVGGGFAAPDTVIPCFGDACQPLPPEPEDPTPGTLRTKKTSGNVPPAPGKKPLKCKNGKVKRYGKCVRKKKHHHKKKKGGHG